MPTIKMKGPVQRLKKSKALEKAKEIIERAKKNPPKRKLPMAPKPVISRDRSTRISKAVSEASKKGGTSKSKPKGKLPRTRRA